MVIEESVLGVILIDSESERCQQALSELTSDMFYSTKNQVLFDLLKRMNFNKQKIDLILVDAALQAEGHGDEMGFAFLADLASIPKTLNFESYVSILKKNYVERKTLGILSECEQILIRKSEGDEENRMADVQEKLAKIDELVSEGHTGCQSFGDLAYSFIEYLENEEKGLSTGIKALDELIEPKGLVSPSLFVIGARPKAGKTSMLVKMAVDCAVNQCKKAVIFSLEMTKNQIMEKIILQASGVHPESLSKGINDFETSRIFNAINDISKTNNLIIDDTPSITLEYVFSECRRIKRKDGNIGMVFIDYLTLMKTGKAERNDLAYGAITMGLKSLAKELNCVVVLITQLNRGLESRADKRPYPSDSRDTGQIEQECDYWVGLYRDSVYNEKADKTIGEMILRLNRHGETGKAYFGFKKGSIIDVDQIDARIKSEESNKKPYSSKF